MKNKGESRERDFDRREALAAALESRLTVECAIENLLLAYLRANGVTYAGDSSRRPLMNRLSANL